MSDKDDKSINDLVPVSAGIWVLLLWLTDLNAILSLAIAAGVTAVIGAGLMRRGDDS